ncbi:hypothetical protein [Calidifontibacillus erzurumensis]|uniref:hypothetical protein n=1 Tax=Calidifontibacillus erzurumensis TaxID=2741433 RepID=UPI0035B568A2
MKEKFIVDRYFCNTSELQKSMNKRFEEGYYPKEIKLDPYQDKVEGFVIYELQEQLRLSELAIRIHPNT